MMKRMEKWWSGQRLVVEVGWADLAGKSWIWTNTQSSQQQEPGEKKMVLEALLVNLAEKLLSFADGEMSVLLGSTSKEELDKLQTRLDRLGGVIRHAEEKRYTDSNVAMFVKELKDAIYDADDVIDAHMIKGGYPTSKARRQLSKQG